MHIFNSRENIKDCIFTAVKSIFTTVKIQHLIFSWERNRKIGTTFFYFLNNGLREASLYGISVSFLRETTSSVSYFYGNVNKKSELLSSLIKERAFINLSATT